MRLPPDFYRTSLPPHPLDGFPSFRTNISNQPFRRAVLQCTVVAGPFGGPRNTVQTRHFKLLRLVGCGVVVSFGVRMCCRSVLIWLGGVEIGVEGRVGGNRGFLIRGAPAPLCSAPRRVAREGAPPRPRFVGSGGVVLLGCSGGLGIFPGVWWVFFVI